MCLFEANKVSWITTPIGMGHERFGAVGRPYVREFVRGQQPEDRHERRTVRRKLPFSGFQHIRGLRKKDALFRGSEPALQPTSKRPLTSSLKPLENPTSRHRHSRRAKRRQDATPQLDHRISPLQLGKSAVVETNFLKIQEFKPIASRVRMKL